MKSALFTVLFVATLASASEAEEMEGSVFIARGFQSHRQDETESAYSRMIAHAERVCGNNASPKRVSEVTEHEDQLGNIRLYARYTCVFTP